jgi:hypothetical protein
MRFNDFLTHAEYASVVGAGVVFKLLAFRGKLLYQ